jgi:tight adherence protein C
VLALTLVWAFLAVLYLGIALLSRAPRLNLKERLRLVKRVDEPVLPEAQALKVPLVVRLVKPLARRLTQTASRVAPRVIRDQVRRLLVLAGSARTVTSEEVLASQAILAVTSGVAGLSLSNSTLSHPGVWFFALAALGGFLPILALRRKIALRHRRILADLPYMLDLMVVCIESGLALDSSIARVTQKVSGPLSAEFAQVTHEVRVGRARREALRDMKDRVGLEEVTAFVAALIQADRMGLSMGQVLRIQADQARMNRQMRARELAQKLPVKLVFPVALLIFPAVGIVCAGPAFLRFLEMLGS